MDRIFLRKMSETYVSDNIDLNLDIEDVHSYLLETYINFKVNRTEQAKDIFCKSRSYQQDLIYTFLDHKYNITNEIDEYEDSLIDEAFFGSDGKLRAFFTNIRSAIKELFSSDNLSDEQKFALTVIEKNLNNCNKSCSITNLEDIFLVELIKVQYSDVSQYSPRLRKYLKRLQRNNENIKLDAIGKCLRFCYLDYMTSIYAEGIISFEVCKSNALGKNMQISSYTEILKNYPIDSVCYDIYLVLTKLYADIIQLLEFIYSKDSFRIKKWTDVIDDKIKAYRQGRNYIIDFNKIDDTFEYPTDNVRVV